MKNYVKISNCCALFSLLNILCTNLIAAPYDDGYGKLWRHPAETQGYTWNQVHSLCPTDGASGCGGALAGWTWATQIQTIELFNRFLPDGYHLTVENPGMEAYVDSPFANTTVFAMNGAPYNFFYATRGWTSSLDSQGLGIRGTISQGGGPVSFYASITANDAFSVSQFPGYLNETGIWLWKSTAVSPADFNGDYEVNGRDLLHLQRNLEVGQIADWQAAYRANSSLVASVAVPEPSAFLLFFLSTMIMPHLLRSR